MKEIQLKLILVPVSDGSSYHIWSRLYYLNRSRMIWLDIRELKQRRFWPTQVNRAYTFYIPEQWFCPYFQLNRLWKCKETKQYKFCIVKAYQKENILTSGWRASLQNAFAPIETLSI